MKVKEIIATKVGKLSSEVIVLRFGGWLEDNTNPAYVPESTETDFSAYDPYFIAAPKMCYFEYKIILPDLSLSPALRIDLLFSEIV